MLTEKYKTVIEKLSINSNIEQGDYIAILAAIHYNSSSIFIKYHPRIITNLLTAQLISVKEGKYKIEKKIFIEELYSKQEDVQVWIKEYLELFPTNLEKIIGYTVSGNQKACITRFKRFFKDTKGIYDKQTVLDATKLYLSEQKKKNWEFTKKAVKFISDIDGSMLELYCEKILNNKLTETLDYSMDKFSNFA